MITRITQETIAKQIESYLKDNTPFTLLEPGSIIGGIKESVAMALSNVHNMTADAIEQTTLSKASGQYLDEIAKIFSIERQKGSYAYSTDVEIYITEDTDAAIVIPIGTQVYGENSDGKYIYFNTKSEATIEPGQRSVTVMVQCIEEGANSHLNTGELNKINIVTIPQVKVRNLSPIYNGQNEESDSNLRYRILNAKYKLAKASTKSIVQNVSEVNGVSDVMATTDLQTTIYIKGTTPNPSEDVLFQAQFAASNNASAGHDVFVKEPEYLQVHLKIKVLSPTNDTQVYIQSILGNYINNLDVGESLNMNYIRSLLISTNNLVDSSINFIIEAYYTRNIYGYDNYFQLNAINDANVYEKFILDTIEVE